MIALLQSFNTIIGPISMLATFAIAFFFVKSGVGKSTSEAQQSAIGALQAEMSVQAKRIDDLKSENKRQEHIIDTICLALKSKGIMITISGDVIDIEGLEGRSATIIRIQDGKEGNK